MRDIEEEAVDAALDTAVDAAEEGATEPGKADAETLMVPDVEAPSPLDVAVVGRGYVGDR